jgi:hypothetical protein
MTSSCATGAVSSPAGGNPAGKPACATPRCDLMTGGSASSLRIREDEAINLPARPRNSLGLARHTTVNNSTNAKAACGRKEFIDPRSFGAWICLQ